LAAAGLPSNLFAAAQHQRDNFPSWEEDALEERSTQRQRSTKNGIVSWTAETNLLTTTRLFLDSILLDTIMTQDAVVYRSHGDECE
jgi:hypothetical protein